MDGNCGQIEGSRRSACSSTCGCRGPWIRPTCAQARQVIARRAYVASGACPRPWN